MTAYNKYPEDKVLRVEPLRHEIHAMNTPNDKLPTKLVQQGKETQNAWPSAGRRIASRGWSCGRTTHFSVSLVNSSSTILLKALIGIA